MLPIYAIEKSLTAALQASGQVVLSAPTGSGKSTQVPKMVLSALEPDKRVLVLQPRRLAARMLAERVAHELGGKPGGLVGYQTRYERVLGKDTRILFITEGILARMLISNPTLPGIGAVIFDEFHERSLNVDLGLGMTRHCRETLRPDLKIVVMSATLNPDPLLAYLPGSVHLQTAGRLYPVDISYLPVPVSPNVFENAARAVKRIVSQGVEGDILIFMPGGYEIRQTEAECRRLHCGEELAILPLYGDLPPETQRAVMEPVPGRRKVVIATNIAETSLTIPGVRHVIDSGLVRVSRYDSIRGIDVLETQKIARDSADQRAGRAGREGPGSCQRLWSELEQSHKPVRSIPEIQRVDLAEAVLSVVSYGFVDVEGFPWYERPPERRLHDACRLLEQLGVVDWRSGLTELGREIQTLPSHLRLSLLLYFGSRQGCFNEAAMGAALLAGRPLLTRGVDREIWRERRQDARHASREKSLPQSDFLVQMWLLAEAHGMNFATDRCRALGVHGGAAREAWRAYEDFLRNGRRMGWKVESSGDSELSFLRCLLRAFPDRLAKRRDQGTLTCMLAGERRGELSKDSVVRDEPLLIAGELRDVAGTGGQGAKLVLGLASGIREEWLWEDFEDALVEGNQVFWEASSQQVRRRVSLSCLGITLEETIRQDPDPQQATEILATLLDEEKLPLPGWDDTVERWIARVRWLAGVMPERELPAYDGEDRKKVHRLLCAGETGYRSVKAKSCLEAVKGIMKPGDVQFVEKNAPAMLHLPNGRRMKIDYVPGQSPRGRAKIQDLYDMKNTIRIAGGREAILMDILAPNNRTVQITGDMESFWAVQYPKIRNQLARRYPRHEWR